MIKIETDLNSLPKQSVSIEIELDKKILVLINSDPPKPVGIAKVETADNDKIVANIDFFSDIRQLLGEDWMYCYHISPQIVVAKKFELMSIAIVSNTDPGK